MVPDAATTVVVGDQQLPAAERLRGARDDRRVLQGPRTPGPGPEPRPGGGDRQRQPAGGREGRQLRPRQRVARATITPGGANALQYEQNLPQRKALYHAAIDSMMTAPSGGGGPVIAVIGSVPSGPQAGYPELALPVRVHRDTAAQHRRRHQRRRLRRAQPDRRGLRPRAGRAGNAERPPAGGRRGPGVLPLRTHRSGGAVRFARSLQSRLQVDHGDARRPRAGGACRSAWRPSRPPSSRR